MLSSAPALHAASVWKFAVAQRRQQNLLLAPHRRRWRDARCNIGRARLPELEDKVAALQHRVRQAVRRRRPREPGPCHRSRGHEEVTESDVPAQGAVEGAQVGDHVRKLIPRMPLVRLHVEQVNALPPARTVQQARGERGQLHILRGVKAAAASDSPTKESLTTSTHAPAGRLRQNRSAQIIARSSAACSVGAFSRSAPAVCATLPPKYPTKW